MKLDDASVPDAVAAEAARREQAADEAALEERRAGERLHELLVVRVCVRARLSAD